jgi:hypothetical protein
MFAGDDSRSRMWRRGHREDDTHLRNRLAVVESVSEDAQGKGLCSIDGFLARLAVGEHPGKVRHFGEPAAVLFLLDFNGQRHDFPSLQLAHPPARGERQALRLSRCA